MCVDCNGSVLLFFALFTVVCVSGNGDLSDVVKVRQSANTIEVLKTTTNRLVIDCFTSNLENFTISWMKDGVFLLPQKRVHVALNGSLIIERFLNKRKKSRDDTGFYECYATNSNGTFIGRQVEVKVIKPTLRIKPEKIDVIAGGIARFQCQIEAATPKAPLCVWEHPSQGSHINGMSSQMGVLQLYNVSDSDEGLYRCRYFTSLVSSDVFEKSASLLVHSGRLPDTPTLLKTPQNLSVIAGRPVLLECLVEGGHNVQISWNHGNGSAVGAEVGKISFTGKSNLHFTNTVSKDTGTYRCVVKHSSGQDITRDYYLDVLEPPRFTATPPIYSANVLKAITRLTCKANGNPTPTVQWYKNGLKLYPAPGVQIIPQLILFGRLEDTGYYQCIANNSLGITMATSWIVFERQPNTPDIVPNVTATAITATKVNVTWSPASTPDGFPIMAYSVDYQLVHDLQCPGRCSFHQKSERDVSNTNFVVINNLKPYTKYSFAVQCLSAKGASTMSNAVTVRTLEAVPNNVPNVQIIPDTSTSFRVSWTEIPVQDRNGIIIVYKLSYGTKERIIADVKLSGETRSHLVTGLEPDIEYVVKVLAGNSMGFPAINNWITYRTPGSNVNESSVPSLTFEPYNATAVSITWSNKDADSTGTYRIIIQKYQERGYIREFNISTDKTRFDIAGLEERVFYTIDFMKSDEKNVVKGYVTELYQSVGPEGEMEPPPPYIVNPHTHSSSVITLSWEAPKTRLNIVKYTIRYQIRDADHMVDLPKFKDSVTTSVDLENLSPFTWYGLSIQSHTETDTGPFSNQVIVQTKEGIPSPPENLLAEVVSPGTVKLKWGPPKKQNGIITYYIIYYNSKKDVPDKAWSSIHQNASHMSVVLEDLKNEIYYFKLRACTNAGKGLTSHVVMIDTLDCSGCQKCTDHESCPDEASENKRNVFEQRLGILIGCAVGVVCIIICITFVVFKQREMRSRYQTRTRTELACRFNTDSQPTRFVGRSEASRIQYHSAYSPMLRRMLENSDTPYKAGHEQRALLSAGSSGSVNNQTSASNPESYDTTPCSSDFDIAYQPMKRCDSSEAGFVMREGGAPVSNAGQTLEKTGGELDSLETDPALKGADSNSFEAGQVSEDDEKNDTTPLDLKYCNDCKRTDVNFHNLETEALNVSEFGKNCVNGNPDLNVI